MTETKCGRLVWLTACVYMDTIRQNKAIIESRLHTWHATQDEHLQVFCHRAKFGWYHTCYACHVLSPFRNTHDAPHGYYVKIWHHPQNWKYLTLHTLLQKYRAMAIGNFNKMMKYGHVVFKLHTHTTVLLLFWNLSGTTRVSRSQKGKTRKGKTNLDLLEQEIVSGSGICWAICKSAPHPRLPRQHPTTQFFTGWMPFLPPNQQRQSTEGTSSSSFQVMHGQS